MADNQEESYLPEVQDVLTGLSKTERDELAAAWIQSGTDLNYHDWIRQDIIGVPDASKVSATKESNTTSKKEEDKAKADAILQSLESQMAEIMEPKVVSAEIPNTEEEQQLGPPDVPPFFRDMGIKAERAVAGLTRTNIPQEAASPSASSNASIDVASSSDVGSTPLSNPVPSYAPDELPFNSVPIQNTPSELPFNSVPIQNTPNKFSIPQTNNVLPYAPDELSPLPESKEKQQRVESSTPFADNVSPILQEILNVTDTISKKMDDGNSVQLNTGTVDNNELQTNAPQSNAEQQTNENISPILQEILAVTDSISSKMDVEHTLPTASNDVDDVRQADETNNSLSTIRVPVVQAAWLLGKIHEKMDLLKGIGSGSTDSSPESKEKELKFDYGPDWKPSDTKPIDPREGTIGPLDALVGVMQGIEKVFAQPNEVIAKGEARQEKGGEMREDARKEGKSELGGILQEILGRMQIGSGKAMNALNNPSELGAAGDALGGAAAVTEKIPVIGPVTSKVFKFGEAVFKTADKIKQMGEKAHEANMQFAEWSGAMAKVQAEQEVRDIKLSKEKGDARAESAKYLAESKSEFAKELAPIENGIANIKNYVVGGITQGANALLKGVKDVAKGIVTLGGLIKIGEDDKDQKQKTQDIQGQLKNIAEKEWEFENNWRKATGQKDISGSSPW